MSVDECGVTTKMVVARPLLAAFRHISIGSVKRASFSMAVTDMQGPIRYSIGKGLNSTLYPLLL